jgi:diguanylate cyclase (GGDEF)-like protein
VSRDDVPERLDAPAAALDSSKRTLAALLAPTARRRTHTRLPVSADATFDPGDAPAPGDLPPLPTGLWARARKTARRGLGDAALAMMLRERKTAPLLVALVGGALAITWSVCVGLSFALHGEVRSEFLLAGGLATFAAAPPMLGLLFLVVRRLRELTAQLQDVAVTDPLTQAYNRRAFQSFMVAETQRATRYKRQLSLILVDLDRFKEINDSFGHAAGDRALLSMVAATRSVLRDADLLFRIGGDEFAVLLPETDLIGATHADHRICEAQSQGDDPDRIPTPVSCGASAYVADSSIGDFIEAADRGLYRAKAAGGGRVETATDQGG